MSRMNKFLGKVGAAVLAGSLALSSMGADGKTNNPSFHSVFNRVVALEQRASDNEAGLLNLARGLAAAHNNLVTNYHAFTNAQGAINAKLRELQLNYSDHFDKNLAVRVEQGQTNSAVDKKFKELDILQRETGVNIRGLSILQEKIGQNLTNYINGRLAGFTNVNVIGVSTNLPNHNYLGFSFPASVSESKNLFPSNYKGFSAILTNSASTTTNPAKSLPSVDKGKSTPVKSKGRPFAPILGASTNSPSINTSNAPVVSTNLPVSVSAYDTNLHNIMSNFTARTEGQISNLASSVNTRFGDLSNRLSLLSSVVNDYTNNFPVLFFNPLFYSPFSNNGSNFSSTNLNGTGTNALVKSVNSTNTPAVRTNIDSKAKSRGKKNNLPVLNNKGSTNAPVNSTNFVPTYIPMSPELTNQIYQIGKRVEALDLRFTGFVSNSAVEIQARMDLLNSISHRTNSSSGATADLSDPRPVLGLVGVGNGTYFVRTNEFTSSKELPYALVNFANHSEMLVPVLATNKFDGKPSQRLNVNGVRVTANKPNFVPFTFVNDTNQFYVFPKEPRASGEPAAYIVPASDAKLNHNLTAVEAPGKIYALQPMRTQDFVAEQKRRESRKRN